MNTEQMVAEVGCFESPLLPEQEDECASGPVEALAEQASAQQQACIRQVLHKAQHQSQAAIITFCGRVEMKLEKIIREPSDNSLVSVLASDDQRLDTSR